MTNAVDLEKRFGAGNYAPLPVTIVRGEGVHVWDDRGRRYLDMLGAYSAVSFGHCHPRLIRALTEQAGRLDILSRVYSNDRLGPFLARACELTGMDRALPMNTGAEAVETALKAARKWAYKVKGVAHDRAEIIAAEGNFHGRTIAVTGLSTVAQYRDGFGPFPPGLVLVPFGDAAALEEAITPNTACFLVEPIQGEGGIVVPPPGYFTEVARICRAHDVLLICDEVQTGLGRTGKLLAVEHEGITPDGVILGKALGGGLIPVSMFLARDEVMGVFSPGDHGSTYGGNPIAAAVGLAALDLLVEDRLVERAAELGDYLLARLKGLESPAIREVRGRGLFAGIEIDEGAASAIDVVEALMGAGVLTKETHRNTVRLAPPFVIEKAEIDEAVDCLAEVLDDITAEALAPSASH
jgi:ornithine--oxo-acid transaminase